MKAVRLGDKKVLLRGSVWMKLPHRKRVVEVRMPPAQEANVGQCRGWAIQAGKLLCVLWLVRVNGGWRMVDHRSYESTGENTFRRLV